MQDRNCPNKRANPSSSPKEAVSPDRDAIRRLSAASVEPFNLETKCREFKPNPPLRVVLSLSFHMIGPTEPLGRGTFTLR
jgi:hypothetical protein